MKFFSINIYFVPEKKIKNLDPKYYAILGVILKLIEQDESIYQNISISPLWKGNNNTYFVKIGIFDEKTYKSFDKHINKKIGQTIRIDAIPFILNNISIIEKESIFDIQEEMQDNNKQDYHTIKIDFLSPTLVKATPYYKLLPKPEIYIYSLINKFEKIIGKESFFEIFGFKNSSKIKSLLEDGILISDYKLEIEKIFIKGGYIPGNIGWIKYSINKHFNDSVFEILQKTLPIFIKGSKRTGLGFGTRLGLGQIQGKTY